MRQNIPTLEDLATEFEAAKAAETAATERRLEIEAAILAHPEMRGLIRDEGSATVGRVTVRTGYTDKWDQQVLDSLSIGVDPQWFPFRQEWKADNKALKVFRERFPAYAEGLREALTRTRRKPAIVVKARAEEEVPA